MPYCSLAVTGEQMVNYHLILQRHLALSCYSQATERLTDDDNTVHSTVFSSNSRSSKKALGQDDLDYLYFKINFLESGIFYLNGKKKPAAFIQSGTKYRSITTYLLLYGNGVIFNVEEWTANNKHLLLMTKCIIKRQLL